MAGKVDAPVATAFGRRFIQRVVYQFPTRLNIDSSALLTGQNTCDIFIETATTGMLEAVRAKVHGKTGSKETSTFREFSKHLRAIKAREYF